MKKITLFALTLVAISAASCSKEYTCQCVYKTDGEVTHQDSHTISEGSKDKSTASCDEMDASSTSTLNGVTYTNTTECSIVD